MAKTCNSCKTDDMAVMPIAQHEKDQNRMMGIIKWLIAVIVILIVLLVGSNIAWIVYENSFEDYVITQDVEQDADNGTNNFIGGDYYGEAEDKNNN
jgi:multisubunit Na+/H+ antiporter MnhB subunit